MRNLVLGVVARVVVVVFSAGGIGREGGFWGWMGIFLFMPRREASWEAVLVGWLIKEACFCSASRCLGCCCFDAGTLFLLVQMLMLMPPIVEFMLCNANNATHLLASSYSSSTFQSASPPHIWFKHFYRMHDCNFRMPAIKARPTCTVDRETGGRFCRQTRYIV